LKRNIILKALVLTLSLSLFSPLNLASHGANITSKAIAAEGLP